MIAFGIAFIVAVSFFLVKPFGPFPINDDWVYALAALRTSETLRFTILGPESAWAIPQTILGAIWIRLLGFSHFHLRLLTLAISCAGTYGFDRLLLLKKADAFNRFLAGLCLIGFFSYLPLATSAMTDLYFFVLWVYACLSIEIAFRTNRDRAWIISALLLLLCCLQRQFGIVIVPAVVVCAVRSKSISFHRVAVVCIVPCIVFFLTAALWGNSSPAAAIPIFQFPNVKQRIGNAFCVLLYLGVGIFPLVLSSLGFKSRRNLWTLGGISLLMVIGTLIVAPLGFRGYVSGGTMPFFGNLLSRNGMFMEGEVLFGSRDLLFGIPFWYGYTLISIIGAAFLLYECFGSGHMVKSNISVTDLSSLLYLAAVIVTRNPLFDRYLLPALAGLLLYLAPSRPSSVSRLRCVLSVCGACSLVLFSVFVTQDFLRWSEAKWNAGEWGVSQGCPPRMIDGGYEWNGWYQYMNPEPKGREVGKKVVISFSPLLGTIPLKVFPYNSWLRAGSLYCLLAR